MPLDSIEDWFKAIENEDLDTIGDNAWVYGSKKNEDGETALMIAVRKRKHVLIPILMPNAITLCNNEGKTALMIAAELDDPDSCSLLVESEAKICTTNGRTALHLAATNNAYHAVRVLAESLEVGKDKDGMTALDLAVNNNCLKSVKALLAHGTWTRYGQLKDYLKIAEEKNYDALAKYLQEIIDEIPQNSTDEMYINRLMDPVNDAVSTVTSISNMKVDEIFPNKTSSTLPPSKEKSCCGQCVGGICSAGSNVYPCKFKRGAIRVMLGLVAATVLSILLKSFLSK